MNDWWLQFTSIMLLIALLNSIETVLTTVWLALNRVDASRRYNIIWRSLTLAFLWTGFFYSCIKIGGPND